ncbi:hypothetical protein [Streptomyces subrutilus]|uniref:hypothetical protein n=1 Tax=Streptomyces subrutilus TaxID=36818 RepID=UPI0033D0F7D6
MDTSRQQAARNGAIITDADALTDAIRAAIDAFLEEVPVNELDTDDLAHAIVHRIRHA